jgi:hypothetical protein
MKWLDDSDRYFVILSRKDRPASKFLLILIFKIVLWKSLQFNFETDRKLKSNEYQWMMAEPHFMALSWRDTKIEWKREKGQIVKEPKIIPSKINIQFFLIDFLVISGDYLKSYHHVDTMDQTLMEFRPKHRCKRWYIPVFWSFLGFALQNAWAIRKDFQHKSGIPHHKVCSQKEFLKVFFKNHLLIIFRN